jgi:hypothetical protein
MLLGELDALIVEALDNKETSPPSDERLSNLYLVFYLLADMVLTKMML